MKYCSLSHDLLLLPITMILFEIRSYVKSIVEGEELRSLKPSRPVEPGEINFKIESILEFKHLLSG